MFIYVFTYEKVFTDDSNLTPEDELGVFLTFSEDQMGQMDAVGTNIVQMDNQYLDDLMGAIAGLERDAAKVSPVPRNSRTCPLRELQNSSLGKTVTRQSITNSI